MHCFHCPNIPVSGNIVSLPEKERQHLFKTLRSGPGEKIVLLDGEGTVASAVVREEKEILVEEVKSFDLPDIDSCLVVAVPKKNAMDLIIRQAVESAVRRVIPVLTEFSVAKPDRPDRWRTLVIEASKQSRNPYFTEIDEPVTVEESVSILKGFGGEVFYGMPGGDPGSPLVRPGSIFSWIVGPEGGFSESELKLFHSSGFHPLSLGETVLRVESAALAGISVLRWLAGSDLYASAEKS